MKCEIGITRLTLPIVLALSLTSEAFAYHDWRGKTADKGITFANESERLTGFERLPSDGLVGAAWLDYDSDGDLDLFIPNRIGGQGGFFENLGDGNFSNITVQSGMGDLNGYSGVVVGDIDNDGYPDLYLSGDGGFFNTPALSRMFYNNGDGTFTDISASSNTPGSESNAGSIFADFNKDGLLDLFTTGRGLGQVLPPQIPTENKLYINNGDLTFTDISVTAGINDNLGSCVARATDHDNDGWMDILVGDCLDLAGLPTPFHLYRNNKDGTFTDIANDVGLTNFGFWMGLTMGDYDNDGDLDIFATNAGVLPFGQGILPHVLYRRNDDGTYTDVTPANVGFLEFGWGASFGDYDNDGNVDLVYVGNWLPFFFFGENGNPSYLFFNDGAGNFVENNEALGISLENTQQSGLAKADYDGDGFMDLIIAREAHQFRDPQTGEPTVLTTGEPILLRNQGNDNHWVTIRLKGKRSNSMGIGAKLTLYTLSGRQIREVAAGSSFQSAETPWPTFGMGVRKRGILKVEWPAGRTEIFGIRANRTKKIVEGRGFRIRRR